MKRAFTLVELLVVISMIAVIMGAMTLSVQKARTRARVAKAMQETRELTNAILAFEQYAEGRSLANYVTSGAWKECTEDSLAMVLGGVRGDGGGEVPVLFNAVLTGTRMLDPWGKPYQFMIDKTDGLQDATGNFRTASALPNYWRLTEKERMQ